MTKEQINKFVLMHSIILISTVLDLQTKFLPELFVILTLVLKHGNQFILDFLLDCICNQLEMTIVLQHFTGNIERKIRRINQTTYKTKVVRQQIGAFIHDQNTVGIQLKTLFIILGIEVKRSLCRNIEQRIIGNRTLYRGVNIPQRVFPAAKLFLEEIIVILSLEFGLCLLPERDHGIQRGQFLIGFPFGFLSASTFLSARTCHLHLDRITNIIGILTNQILQIVCIQELVIVFVLCVLLNVQRNYCAAFFFFCRGNRKAINAIRLPKVSRLCTIGTRKHLNLFGNHKCRIKTDTKLTNNINIGLLSVLFLKSKGSGMRDRTKIVLHLFSSHTAAVVGDRQRACLLINIDTNRQIITQDAGFAGLSCMIIQLISRIRCVGDQLAEKNFLMCIDRVDHQFQQSLGLSLKLLLFHDSTPQVNIFSTLLSRVPTGL